MSDGMDGDQWQAWQTALIANHVDPAVRAVWVQPDSVVWQWVAGYEIEVPDEAYDLQAAMDFEAGDEDELMDFDERPVDFRDVLRRVAAKEKAQGRRLLPPASPAVKNLVLNMEKNGVSRTQIIDWLKGQGHPGKEIVEWVLGEEPDVAATATTALAMPSVDPDPHAALRAAWDLWLTTLTLEELYFLGAAASGDDIPTITENYRYLTRTQTVAQNFVSNALPKALRRAITRLGGKSIELAKDRVELRRQLRVFGLRRPPNYDNASKAIDEALPPAEAYRTLDADEKFLLRQLLNCRTVSEVHKCLRGRAEAPSRTATSMLISDLGLKIGFNTGTPEALCFKIKDHFWEYAKYAGLLSSEST